MRYVVAVLFAIAAFLLVMMCMPNTGAIYTHDTQSYEYAAATLLESGQLKYFGYDTPIIQWPPFYIVILAITKWMGVSVAQGAAWINALAFAYLLYAIAIFFFNHLEVKWMAIPGLLLTIASVPLLIVSGYGWSELLFVFLCVLSVLFILQYLSSGKAAWFYTSAVISSLCWLTRYLGIVVIALLALILLTEAKPFLLRLKNIVIYGLISCLPMSFWVARNYLISQTLTGGRQPGNYTWAENIQLSVDVFESWFIYLEPMFTYAAAGYFVFLCVLALFLIKKKGKKDSPIPKVLFFLLFILLYAGALLASASTAAMDPISTRLWVPVYPFFMLTLVFLLDALLRKVRIEKMKHWLVAGFMLFSLVAIINPVFWFLEEGLARKDLLTGTKESEAIQNSPALKLVRDTLKPSPQTLVITNDAGIISMHTDLKCYYPPKKTGIPLYLFDRYKERIEEFPVIYLAWVGRMESESFMDVPDFLRMYDMEKVAQNNYCIIYKIR